MKLVRSLLVLTSLIALTPSCDKVKSLLDTQTAAAAAAEGGAAGTSAEATAAGAGGSAGQATQETTAINKYALPFVYDAASDEPLARARAYLKEVVSDNGTYATRGAKYFSGLVDHQAPRATIVTCSDSQVHQRAWHATPENDDYVIRNLGNQIGSSEGSIEYGIDHLHTPLLLIVGHSGCDAVKLALGDIGKESKGVQADLKHINLPKPDPSLTEKAVLKNAVLANVHNQVEYAVKKFGELVQEGKLTVVGTVYDHKNDHSEGAGKLVIVNVNGNSEPKRMKAFTDAINAVQAGDRNGAAGDDPASADRAHNHKPPSKEDIDKTIKAVSEILNRDKTARK